MAAPCFTLALIVCLFVVCLGRRARQSLPQVNKELALKLMDEAETVTEAESQGRRVKANKMLTASLLKDDRFGALFKNPDFEIDKTAEEFRLINPVVSRLDQQRQKQLQKVFT